MGAAVGAGCRVAPLRLSIRETQRDLAAVRARVLVRCGAERGVSDLAGCFLHFAGQLGSSG